MHEIEVFLILDDLDGKKSFGVDKLHPFLASVGAFQIFLPITYIIPIFKQDSVHCVIIIDQYQFFQY